MTLEALHTVDEVAAALGESEYYVREKCRRGEWPHTRGARGKPAFTAAHYAQILELIAQPAGDPEPKGLSFAPRSRRGAA